MVLTTLKTEILSKIASDHNLVMWIERTFKSRYVWRLSEDLLNSRLIIEQLKEETRSYFEINLGNKVPIQMVWDAYKAVIGVF